MARTGRPKKPPPPDNQRCVVVGKNGRCRNARLPEKTMCGVHLRATKFKVGKKPRFFVGWDSVLAYVEDRIIDLHEDRVLDRKEKPFTWAAKASMLDKWVKHLLKAMENRDKAQSVGADRVMLCVVGQDQPWWPEPTEERPDPTQAESSPLPAFSPPAMAKQD